MDRSPPDCWYDDGIIVREDIAVWALEKEDTEDTKL